MSDLLWRCETFQRHGGDECRLISSVLVKCVSIPVSVVPVQANLKQAVDQAPQPGWGDKSGGLSGDYWQWEPGDLIYGKWLKIGIL
jgi:hypothetical protein